MTPDAHTGPAASRRDSIGNTLLVAVCLSLVCSLLVSGTAVLLKPQQVANAERYRQSIILDVAGLLTPGADVEALFDEIEIRIVRLEDGSYADAIDPDEFDPREAVNDPDYAVAVPEALDLANLHQRASHAPVYIVRQGGEIEQVILPVHGAGLWSMMYGYLAVAGDGETVRAIRFYEHAETPGLGDQIDNPEWRAQWAGKRLYGADGTPQIEVARGFVAAGEDDSHKVDGISGATLTGRGVTALVRYWTGPHGFGPYLARLRNRHDGND